jgi:F-type H+-transporting ATPase subunit b
MHELPYQIINFVIFAFVIVYFVRKPFLSSLKKRHDELLNAIEQATKAKQEVEQKLVELERKIASLEEESTALLQKAKQDALDLKNKIILDANLIAKKIYQDSEIIAKSAVEDQSYEIRKEIVQKTVLLAEKMITEKLSSEDQKRIVNQYVGEIV